MIEPDLIPDVSRSSGDREARSRDFGGMVRLTPDGAAAPGSVEEISAIVRAAARDKVPLAIRGAGHSQGGQCLTDRGIVMDMTRLRRIRLQGRELVRAQGGARWGDIVMELRGTRRLPRVLADIAAVTVGGTLSAGGTGTSSHRHGLQVGQVEQLEVVTGAGERVRCSRSRNAELFNAVRGGQGQFGVITEAWIRLRKTGRRLRRYALRYRDFERFAQDFERLVDEDRFDHLRAEIRGHDNCVVLRAGAEYDRRIDDERVLMGLDYDTMTIVWDLPDTGRTGVSPGWVRAGMLPGWMFSPEDYHPWRDWFLPWEAIRTALVQPWLDLRHLPRAPRSWVGIQPIGTEAVDAPLVARPEGRRMFSYSILAVMREYTEARALAERLKQVDKAIVALGGKAYLSGGADYGYREWKEHYGDTLESGIRWKREFDPGNVFRAGGMPFGHKP